MSHTSCKCSVATLNNNGVHPSPMRAANVEYILDLTELGGNETEFAVFRNVSYSELQIPLWFYC